MFSYNSAILNEKTFISLTSLTIIEFNDLCKIFFKQWEKYTNQESRDSKNGGRPPSLKTIEDRLFFILFYLKTYPLQEVIAYCFDISQGTANVLIHQLSYILKLTLAELGYVPARVTEDMIKRLQFEEIQPYAIDGTERPIVRPSDNAVQKIFYSGKKKHHTIKNNLLIGINDRQIKYLGDTHEGKKHDKKIAEEEQFKLPSGSDLYQDTGYQGLKLDGVNTYQPKKKPKGENLTEEEKSNNRLISSVRVVVEHVISGVKRLHIVNDIFRNTKSGYDDLVLELSSALHNFRSYNRFESY
jgi:hypothetical protein